MRSPRRVFNFSSMLYDQKKHFSHSILYRVPATQIIPGADRIPVIQTVRVTPSTCSNDPA